MSRVPIGVDHFHQAPQKGPERVSWHSSIRRQSFGVETTTVPLRQHDLHEPRFDARRRCIELSTSVRHKRQSRSAFGPFRSGWFGAI